ncbi:RcnB family protein [Sphingobium sp. BYY-5]|uniref:RcnB family protein n=1 Tax=Sphingobium sp. BYY-5 TaxID=2926400 RepID=UPI001FA6ACB5|nr:RcnB family protein [Sphingobium sp. BYY-5]MCI4591390.1 RcnB family protein [Sphingobium sp. BYY-5]
MFRKMMLAGLMGATLLSGIAPAYAQAGQERGDRSERSMRQGGDAASRGNRMTQPRGDDGGQRWQQRGDAGRQGWQQRAAERPAGQAMPQRPDPRWRGDSNPPANRAIENAVRDQQQQQRNWRDARRDDRPAWGNDRRDGRQDGRPDGRGNDRPDWRNDRRNDRPDWRNDRRDGRQDGRPDQRWSDNRGWNGANWNNNGRRFDDRTRWNDQRRWDSGWRQDRRYDWNSYRNRYGDRYRIGRYYAPRGWNYGYRPFSVGIVLNSSLYANNYWLNDPYSYRLPPAYGTLRWVRYYDDALLVDVRDGYVVDVIRDFFW